MSGLTPAQVAQLLGTTTAEIRRLIRSGDIVTESGRVPQAQVDALTSGEDG